ncbi:hypothetical protein [Paracoccus hibiscisoli]|uniref:Uncharacterized protein n=1 Tax=Paracoccus hibiscisoli TaxID=2023261 RepID=A0A4U0QUN3_9RHOB|nr:hypothetical protein [Paracoccus hibiscisoli]TJZ85795.1 hypothetical protein FA740_05190 [Paracoccus hibiscisoli]
MTPRTMALAAILHHDCTEFTWERTSAQIADDLVSRYPACREWGVTARHVARTAREKGWSNRLRGAGTPVMQGTPKAYSMDQELAQLDGGRGFDLTPEPAALNF